jgi:hypothetical protein
MFMAGPGGTVSHIMALWGRSDPVSSSSHASVSQGIDCDVTHRHSKSKCSQELMLKVLSMQRKSTFRQFNKKGARTSKVTLWKEEMSSKKRTWSHYYDGESGTVHNQNIVVEITYSLEGVTSQKPPCTSLPTEVRSGRAAHIWNGSAKISRVCVCGRSVGRNWTQCMCCFFIDLQKCIPETETCVVVRVSKQLI